MAPQRSTSWDAWHCPAWPLPPPRSPPPGSSRGGPGGPTDHRTGPLPRDPCQEKQKQTTPPSLWGKQRQVASLGGFFWVLFTSSVAPADPAPLWPQFPHLSFGPLECSCRDRPPLLFSPAPAHGDPTPHHQLVPTPVAGGPPGLCVHTSTHLCPILSHWHPQGTPRGRYTADIPQGPGPQSADLPLPTGTEQTGI